METAPGRRSRWLDDKGYGRPARGEGDWEVLCAPRMGKALAVLGSMPGAAADCGGTPVLGNGDMVTPLYPQIGAVSQVLGGT